MACIFCYTVGQYGTFHVLNDVIFVRSDIYQLKSIMHKNVLSYIKTGTVPVWLVSENYSSTFYLVTLNGELDFGRKHWEQKNPNMLNRRIRVCIRIHFSHCGMK